MAFLGLSSLMKRPCDIRFLALMVTALCLASPAFAQLGGHNTKGDYGLQSGTQPPPGWYVIAPMYYSYTADEFRDRNGDRLSALGGGGSVEASAWIGGGIWVSEYRILGGNYSFAIYPGLTDNALEFPPLGIDERVSIGFADLYVQPVNLGWHTEWADFIAGIGIYAPTGTYAPGGSNNRGLGMWSFEVFAGTTIYLDPARSWHFAATAFYETHSKKDDTNVKVGDILTVEGGLGKSFMDGAVTVGAAYYAQWKLTDDEFGLGIMLPVGRKLGRNRVYGVGPEVSVALATQDKLIGFLNLRYLWEFGARTALQGETFVGSLTFPIPSVPLQ